MTKQRKRLIIYPTIGLLIFLSIFWKIAGDFISPTRRELQPYHNSYLTTPDAHGLLLSHHVFGKAQVPTLIARPDSTREPSPSGQVLRSQLHAKGIFLAPPQTEQAIIVLLHGRKGRKEDMLPIAALSLPDLPASLWGMSMGGSFAIHAAAQNPDPWSSLTIICSFDKMDRVVKNQLGWLAGLGKTFVELRHGPNIESIRPIDLAPQITQPTLLVHGNADTLIDIEQGRALHAAFPNTAPFMEVDGGTHSTILITDAPIYATTAAHILSTVQNADVTRKKILKTL